jgi:hypothetical protein
MPETRDTRVEKVHDKTMIAAGKTAARNPLQPPERLPRDAATAIKMFAAHPSTQLLALASLAAWAVRERTKKRAGEGNRTLVCSLGSCRSTIELRPHGPNR